MGFLDSLKSWLSSEASEASDVGRQTKGRLEAELDRRQAELAASPMERMEQLQAQIDSSNDAFDSIRGKIEGREMKAEAVSEVADIDSEHRDGGQDVVDAVIEEADDQTDSPVDDAPDENKP